jgi:hypothetical protein
MIDLFTHVYVHQDVLLAQQHVNLQCTVPSSSCRGAAFTRGELVRLVRSKKAPGASRCQNLASCLAR